MVHICKILVFIPVLLGTEFCGTLFAMYINRNAYNSRS